VPPTAFSFSVPLFGDINGDVAINFQDINPFIALIGGSPTQQQLWAADFNWDGVINFQDINGFVAALSAGGPVPADGLAALGAVVPEPGSLSILAGSLIGLATRRRRA